MLAHEIPLIQLFRQDRRAIELERQVVNEMPGRKAQLRSTADPYSSVSSHKIDLAREPFCVYGRIVDYVPFAHYYRVQLDRGGGVVQATPILQASHEFATVRELNTYTVGTGVWVIWHPHMQNALILGSAPDFGHDARHGHSDWVSQGSRVGLNVDDVFKFPFQLALAGGVIDWSAGRPIDALHGGDWGAAAYTGLSFFLDPFMVYMRVDEETGVWGFYDDQLLRVAGHNLQMRSAGHDRTDHDDEEEFNSIQAYTPYLWEARGGFSRKDTRKASDGSSKLWREVAAINVQQGTPHYSYLEPAIDNQQAMHRYRQFLGYLGQGRKTTLFLPCPPVKHASVDQITTDNATGEYDEYQFSTNVLAVDDRVKFPGVYEENVGLDGSLATRSAKSIILSKRLLIPEPKRVKEDPDLAGDRHTNYKANGVYGTGEAHKIGDIAYPIGTHQNLTQAAAFLDVYAHAFNWKGVHPFEYHGKDWYMPEESEYPYADEMGRGNPPFGALRSGHYLLAPVPVALKVDDRYGQVAYFPNDSYIALLDDGGIVIGDGYGSEIRMTGGNIYRTAPGDLYDLSGKNTVCWAGHDWIARANFSAELDANKCNVRIKADNKVMIYGGNQTCGGVLIESKAPGIAFETVTNPFAAPVGEISQSGGLRNDLQVAFNPLSWKGKKLKETYLIRCIRGGKPGEAVLQIISESGTDSNPSQSTSSYGAATPIGSTGASATWTNGLDHFVAGQEWTAYVTVDPNDINDMILGGILFRAKHSVVYTYANHIHSLLSQDGASGMMVHDCGRNGTLIQHGAGIIRHIEGAANDVFWETGAPELIIIKEDTPAVKDESKYFGPNVTYTITCIFGNLDQPVNAARVSVAGAGDDDDGVVVAVLPDTTPIGNRGFRWAPIANKLVAGMQWIYLLKQKAEVKCVNQFKCEGTQIGSPVIIENNLFVDGCISANGVIASADQVVAPEFGFLDEDQIAEFDLSHAHAQDNSDALKEWAAGARADITVIKDTTKVTKLEFFFQSSFQAEVEPPWRLYESRWHQQDRHQNNYAVAWTESPVFGEDAFTSVEFEPWPGRYSWKRHPSYILEDVDLFNLHSSLSVDRKAPYESPSFVVPGASIFEGQWRIIKNPCVPDQPYIPDNEFAHIEVKDTEPGESGHFRGGFGNVDGGRLSADVNV
jgi:hypothetical protein